MAKRNFSIAGSNHDSEKAAAAGTGPITGSDLGGKKTTGDTAAGNTASISASLGTAEGEGGTCRASAAPRGE